MFVDDLPMDVDNRASIGALARTLLDEISRTFYVNQQEVYLTASVGVAELESGDLQQSIGRADVALYRSEERRVGKEC